MSQSKKIPINIRLSNGDIEILDFIAAKTGETRSKLLTKSIENDIDQMFGALGYAEKANLANLVDSELTKKGHEHEYRGSTWYWMTVGQDPDKDNPVENEKWVLMKENLHKSN